VLTEAQFREHTLAAAITTMSSTGNLLGAEFVACTGGNLDAIGGTARLAGIAGLPPVPNSSGHTSGNMRRPHRFHRRPPTWRSGHHLRPPRADTCTTR
jgi:hypothetical protein